VPITKALGGNFQGQAAQAALQKFGDASYREDLEDLAGEAYRMASPPTGSMSFSGDQLKAALRGG
jgi:hypothetical protein